MTLSGLEELGITKEMIMATIERPDRLDALRAWGRSGWRELAREHHPDLGGDKDEFVRTKRIMELLEICTVQDLAALVGLTEWYERRCRADAMGQQVREILTHAS